MNKKTAVFIILVLIIVGGWFGYKKYTTTTGKITIGAVQWTGNLGLYIAADKGYFKDAGLDVEVINYSSNTEEDQAYISGKTRGAANLTLTAVNQAYQGLDHKVVAVIDYSNGSDGIIARPNIKTFADIKGKRVAFDHGTLEEFFLRHALEQHRINFTDIVPINLSPEKSAEAVVKGEADVGVTYEPFMSGAIASGGAKKIYSSADAPGLITDVLTFHSDFIFEHPKAVEAIIREYFRAIKFWKEHPEEANIIMAKRLGVAPEEVPAQLAGLIIPDEQDNRIAFTFAPGPESLYGNMRKIGEFVKKHRPAGSEKVFDVDTDTLIEPRFIRSILRGN